MLGLLSEGPPFELAGLSSELAGTEVVLQLSSTESTAGLWTLVLLPPLELVAPSELAVS